MIIWGLRKSRIHLIKSSLVFVLVESGRLTALLNLYNILQKGKKT